MEAREIAAIEAKLLTQAQEKFSVKSDRLDGAMRKIGRRVPRKVHKAADVIVAAGNTAGHPKLRLMIDDTAVKAAFKTVQSHLKSVDPRDRRKGLILSTLGMVAANVIAVLTILVLVLHWRGYL